MYHSYASNESTSSFIAPGNFLAVLALTERAKSATVRWISGSAVGAEAPAHVLLGTISYETEGAAKQK